MVISAAQTAPGPSHGWGPFLLETLAVLAALALLAWALVRFAGPRLRGARGRGRMKIVERLPLEPRRSLYLVEVDGRTLLVGASEGAVSLLEGPEEGPADHRGERAGDGET